MNFGGKRYTDSNGVCARYGNRHRRTLGRWLTDPSMGFPKPIRLNGRLFFDEAELDAFDAKLIEASLSKEAA